MLYSLLTLIWVIILPILVIFQGWELQSFVVGVTASLVVHFTCYMLKKEEAG